MTKDQAREFIIARGTDKLTPAKSKVSGKVTYICPLCNNGAGKDGTGITSPDGGKHYKCFKCDFYGDIIDLIGAQYNLTEYNDKLQKACELYGIQIDGTPSSNAYKSHTQDIHIHTTQPQEDEEEEADYTSFYRECAARIEETDYPQRRGLSLPTLKRFLVGFCPDWKHPKSPKAPGSPRLIIPTSKSSYLARETRAIADIPEADKKYIREKEKAGKTCLFNVKAIDTADKPIIVVEGEIDALSVIEVGGESIGLGGTSGVRMLLNRLEKGTKPKHPLILSLDTDQAGRDAEAKLKAGLDSLKIPYYCINVAEGYKDPNDVLCADKVGFKTIIDYVEAYPNELERDKLQKESALASFPMFMKHIEDSKIRAYIPTGFSSLDNLLDGGLYAGLYVIGAISSLGKTTFCLQMADQIAKSGHDVLIFSLEMARDELIAKSLSRLTFLYDKSDKYRNSKTVRGILTGSRWEGYNQEEKTLIDVAIEQYKGYAGHIYITEGVGDVGIKEIRERVEKHTHITGTAPVVIIDYLQIISPADPHFTDKQNTDKAVLELKRLSRDKNIAIIGISSFNRDNYTSPVNLASFKESGAIEYSSDVLIGLQYEGMDYQESETEKQREKRIRSLMSEAIKKAKDGEAQKIEIKILKNRSGSKGAASLFYYPKFSCFKDVPASVEEKTEWLPLSEDLNIF